LTQRHLRRFGCGGRCSAVPVVKSCGSSLTVGECRNVRVQFTSIPVNQPPLPEAERARRHPLVQVRLRRGLAGGPDSSPSALRTHGQSDERPERQPTPYENLNPQRKSRVRESRANAALRLPSSRWNVCGNTISRNARTTTSRDG
jgi:hypothetical protein